MNASRAHRTSRRSNAATAQFYRWFQLYERPWTSQRIERQLQLFADEFTIIRADMPEVGTREQYRLGMAQFDPAHRHAHHVERVSVEELDEHRLRLTARANYQTQGPDGSRAGSVVSYDCELVGSVSFEPLFTSLAMNVESRQAEASFTDAYPVNRARSFVHRWLALVEAPGLGALGFNELLPPDGRFDLHMGQSRIRDRSEMSQWLHASAQRVSTSRHNVKGFHVRPGDGTGRYMVEMDFDWAGTSAEGAPMAGLMHHAWTLQDDGERYCRLVAASTVPLVPIGPTEEHGTGLPSA
jgi:hypothetical protein